VHNKTITMGTVHGVYLKYVGLSALSYAGYTMLLAYNDKNDQNLNDATPTISSIVQLTTRVLLYPFTKQQHNDNNSVTSTITNYRNHNFNLITSYTTLLFHTLPVCILGYSTILNGVIALLFKLEWGMQLIGKDRSTGQIPLWSHIIFFPFHIPTRLYTYIHSLQDQKKRIPVASEVVPGWYVGGCYGHYLHKEWAGVIDLTVEFPETTIHNTKAYLSIPTWDGIPASPAQLEDGATFAVAAREQFGGDVLIHCAHGRGRSTTMMCAALVKAKLYTTWEEAFELGIKPRRSVCKLNRRMKQNLTEWQRIYVDEKKGQ
jgi:Dual specificity phosphatase, catalytic domain